MVGRQELLLPASLSRWHFLTTSASKARSPAVWGFSDSSCANEADMLPGPGWQLEIVNLSCNCLECQMLKKGRHIHHRQDRGRFANLASHACCRSNLTAQRPRACLKPHVVLSPHVAIRQAHTTAEWRAAAYLRAASFYHYPPDRSEYAARAHRRMKADSEWDAIEAKVRGTDRLWKASPDAAGPRPGLTGIAPICVCCCAGCARH